MIDEKIERPSWDEYFMKSAFHAAERSSCIRHHVGAVAVKNKRIVATGYNGAPPDVEDCIDLGCLREEKGIASGERHEICRAIHAEQNVIVQAAKYGTSIEGATLYTTHSPCNLCAKLIAGVGIEEVIACNSYPDLSYMGLFREKGIRYRTMPKPVLNIRILD